MGGLRLSPHGAPTCLYGVSDSRASPRLYLGAIFVCYIRTARSPRCEWRRWLSCHRMAHCVLIRCYLQPSLSEALPWCYLCLLHTDSTLSEVRVCGRTPSVTAWRTTCLYGVTYSRASPRLFLGAIFVCYIQTAPPRGANVCWRASSVTAWRTYVLIRCFLQLSLAEALF